MTECTILQIGSMAGIKVEEVQGEYVWLDSD